VIDNGFRGTSKNQSWNSRPAHGSNDDEIRSPFHCQPNNSIRRKIFRYYRFADVPKRFQHMHQLLVRLVGENLKFFP